MGSHWSRRRSLRRHVGVSCSVASNLWDGSVEFGASDLSHEGLWIDTPYPLELGDEVVLSFVPPGAAQREALWAIAEVARVGLWDESSVPWSAGMGLTFTYVHAVDRRYLVQSLLGRPPRLPRTSPKLRAPAVHQPPPLPASAPSRSQAANCAQASALAGDDDRPRRTQVVYHARRPPALPGSLPFADVPPVLDADLALAFAPQALGALLS